MKTFQHINARTTRQAVKLLKDYGGKSRVLAGGTDLLGALKDRILPDYPEALVNLKSIPELDYIKQEGRSLRIGALAKLADVASAAEVRDQYPLLAAAAAAVASPQIRNMATIGGNICQDVRCWYYRYPHAIGERIFCYLKGGKSCYALNGENQYHSIFGGCRVADTPCTQACRGTIQIATYLGLVREGKLAEAAAVILKNNPLPAVTGRVCPHWCEQECNRQEFDQPVSIRGIERHLGDYILDNAAAIVRPPAEETGKKVAVVGSGPAGLAAAYYLRMTGHQVTVFDKMPAAGGMLTYGIPAYRLPKDIVRRAVAALEKAGVQFKLQVEIGKDIPVENLKRDFDAVFLAAGLWKQRAIGLEGEHLTKSGLEFLINTNLGNRELPGKKVLVIGGGNVAVDVSITARRLGAAEVTLACLECRTEMPAFPAEIEQALEEGVQVQPSWGPSRVLTDNGKATGMEMVCCTSVFDPEGRFCPSYDQAAKTTFEADVIIMAVGQAADLTFLGTEAPLKLERGLIAVDRQTQETSLPGVFAGGEVAAGPGSVIESMAAGRRAAEAINDYLGFKKETGQEDKAASFLKFESACLKKTDRLEVAKIDLSRRGLEIEDAPGFSAGQFATSADRCFNCGCVAVSPSDMAVALMALNAKMKIAGPHGARVVRIEEFFTAAGKALKEEEIVTEIQVPRPPAAAKQAFQKFRIRKSLDFPIVSIASLITVQKGICQDARIVLGAVAPAPFRALAAEQAVKGKPLNTANAEAAAAAALEGVIPLMKNEYKIQITRTLIKRALLGE